MTLGLIEWMADAACADMDTRLFYPKGNPWHPGYKADVANAARICRDCPVIFQCRSAADAADERHGVWAGFDYGAGWNPTGKRRRAGHGPGRRVVPRVVPIELAAGA